MNVYSRTPSIAGNRNLAQTGLAAGGRGGNDWLKYLGSLGVQLASGIAGSRGLTAVFRSCAAILCWLAKIDTGYVA